MACVEMRASPQTRMRTQAKTYGSRSHRMESCGEGKLTAEEIPLLPERFNLTDGHVFREWSSAEAEIIHRTPSFFTTVDRRMQEKLEAGFIQSLMTLTRQTYDPSLVSYLVTTTASESLEIIANFLRLRKMRLTLIEPCFDNLADIFKRHWLELSPVSEETLTSPGLEEHLERVGCEAICLVSPNNPTGYVLSQGSMARIIEYCRKSQAILIIDASFRAYIPSNLAYDQYSTLIDSGISFIVIEDTGKTWPTMELKASVLAVSPDLLAPIFDIYADLLLHVSPFTIRLLTEFVTLSIADNSASIHGVINQNRQALYAALEGSVLTPVEQPYCSVSWIRAAGLAGADVARWLAKDNVFVLKGDRFFWADPVKGRNYIRVALARTPKIFAEAAELIRRRILEEGWRVDS